uniref:Uncharacterized protein n=1 Tax=Bos indicus x Bos taurus TaxID=30522 RepID=A0A4W2EQQ8_BOBOX
MFLLTLLTEGVHQRTALPDRQTYTWGPHVHVTSRGNGNLWPQCRCPAQMPVIRYSYPSLTTCCVSGTKLYVLYTFSCHLYEKVGHFIPIFYGKTENVKSNL